MPTYEYLCEVGHRTEARAGYEDYAPLPCPAPGCSLPATRQSVYLITPFTESGVKVGRINSVPLDEKRVKLSKYKEAASEVEHAFSSFEQRHGVEIDRPSYFKEGLKRAHEVAAGVRPPPKERF